MQIENVDPNKLIAYSLNNKKHTAAHIDRVANSIKEAGWTQPIVVDSDNVIVVGHARCEAAKKLGLEEVPIVKLSDCSPAQIRAIRILDNKLSRDSEWDFDNLGLELEVLKEANFDLSEWGLDVFLPAPVIPQEYTEEIAEGVVLEAKFKIVLPADDSDSFEERLDELLRSFPSAKKEKSL